MSIQDLHSRVQALDPTQSFIVQAPAGSGKTELLTQRFLKLLSVVEKSPEEIIAITFTRKAAAEMRERIIVALQNATENSEPALPHHKTTYQLAIAALARDKQLVWNLLENPNRLRILTIDALSASLATQTPLLSQFGAKPNIVENASQFYNHAVTQLIKSLDDDPPYAKALESLLLHLDNRVYQLQELLTQILAKREQWLPSIFSKKDLEKGLQAIIIESLQAVDALLDDQQKKQIAYFAHFAANNLVLSEPDHPIGAFKDVTNWPECTIENFPLWLAITNLLLTQTGTWRKTVTKANGFPAKHEVKEQFLQFLTTVELNDSLLHALNQIQLCPPAFYDQQQRVIIDALLELLPILTAYLQLEFQQHGVVDFVELSLAALRALGDDDSPTDLALYLDYQIRHLLIDEFQDTSVTQFTLIEKIISGWQPGDGRSLFLVGDPMQSIYRFREAQVGLFLRTKLYGIGQVSLTFLTLSMNFRSDTAVVDWINQQFPSIFPQYTDIATGAVPYSPAIAAKPSSNFSGIYANLADDFLSEAELVLQTILQLQQKFPKESIAILVRSRSQLLQIITRLNQQQIAFHAVDIESLAHRPEIQDLVTLTKALHNLADRVAWLALLRAPFCGLALADLLIIAQDSLPQTIWDSLKNWQNLPLSDDGKQRLQRIVSALQLIFNEQGRKPLPQWLETAWLALAMPAAYREAVALDNAKCFFDFVATLDQQKAFDCLILEQRIAKLAAQSHLPADYPLQIMTIHKSKGLEFDHVLLPGLAKRAAHDPSQLFMWLERPNQNDQTDLIIAPIKSATQKQDAIYTYLRSIEKEKSHHELSRLFYVAITRARKSVHLFAETATPAAGSFLQLVWPAITEIPSIISETKKTITEIPEAHPDFYRLTTDWQYPSTKFAKNFTAQEINHNPPSHKILEQFSLNIPSITGTLIHLALQHLATGVTFSRAFWQNQAENLLLPENEFENAYQKIQLAISNTLNDPHGKWLMHAHNNSHTELAISTVIMGEIHHLIIDRTFIDEQGTRWIIDYKTTINQDIPLDEFIVTENKKHQAQLSHYATALATLSNHPIKCALYYPLIPHFADCPIYAADISIEPRYNEQI